MENHPVTQSIRQFILQSFPSARKREVGNDDSLLDSGIVDSLGVLDIVAFVQSEFGVAAEDDELVPDNFRSIHHISEFVRRKQQDGAGASR